MFSETIFTIGLFCFSLPCLFQDVRGQPNPRPGVLEDALTNMVGVQMCVLRVGSNSTSGSSLSNHKQHMQCIYKRVVGFIFWGAKCAGAHDLTIAWCLDLASKCALPSECTDFSLPINKDMSESRDETKCQNVPGSLHSTVLANLTLPIHFLGDMLIWQVWQGWGFVEVTYTSAVLIGVPQYSSSLPSSPRAGLN